tara:strand:- start:258 stop:407 length:150 start_codon:yes stop_codon:yes gene_type:complete
MKNNRKIDQLAKAEKLLQEISSHQLGQSGDRSNYPCSVIEKYFKEKGIK